MMVREVSCAVKRTIAPRASRGGLCGFSVESTKSDSDGSRQRTVERCTQTECTIREESGRLYDEVGLYDEFNNYSNSVDFFSSSISLFGAPRSLLYFHRVLVALLSHWCWPGSESVENR